MASSTPCAKSDLRYNEERCKDNQRVGSRKKVILSDIPVHHCLIVVVGGMWDVVNDRLGQEETVLYLDVAASLLMCDKSLSHLRTLRRRHWRWTNMMGLHIEE